MDIEFHLAQLNVGRAKGPMDGSVMAGFKAALDDEVGCPA